MREIKFRGFSEQQNKWIYGGYHKPFDDITQIIDITKNNASQMSLIKNGTEGQFTGLKDKNGVDRYDGDIIKRNTGYTFLEGKKYFSLGDKNNAKCFGYDYHPDDEVIGNIHENPELIK